MRVPRQETMRAWTRVVAVRVERDGSFRRVFALLVGIVKLRDWMTSLRNV